MIRIRLINEGKVVKQITSRVHEGVVLEQINKFKDPFDTIQIVEGDLSEDAKSMLQHVARKIVPAAMAAGLAMGGANTAQAQGGVNPNYPGLNKSVGQHMTDIFSPNYKETMRQREHGRNTERQVWNAEQDQIRKQRVADARASAGGGAIQKHVIYDQSRLSKDGKSYIVYGIDNTVRRIPVTGTEYMAGDSQRLPHYITSGGNVLYVRHPHAVTGVAEATTGKFVQQGHKIPRGYEMTAHGRIVKKGPGPDMSNQGVGGDGTKGPSKAIKKASQNAEKKVAEGVADSMTMDEAKKVLRHNGADKFKTTSNELHFYKNGKPFSVGLTLGADGVRSVSLSSLNSATRKLKGVVVGEGVMNKIADKVMGAAPEQPKYKVGQRVKYETSPHQPEWKDGGRGVGVITAYKNGHYMINGNPVNHFEIKGAVAEGYAVTRGIDKERYTERPGLEGPFSTRSGKVVYYDKAEGKYYDPETDFYIGHEDYAKMDEDATVGTIPASGTVGTSGTSGSMTQRTQFAPTGKTTNAKFNKNGQIELDSEQEDDGSVNLDADAVKQLQQAGVQIKEGSDTLEGILSKFSTDYAKFKAGGDIDENQDFFDALYDHYSDTGEMPYTIAKGRDGDPYEWITQRLDQESGVDPVAEAEGDDATADQNIIMQIRKASDYEKPTKIKLADSSEVVIAPNIARQLLAKFEKMKPDSKELLQNTLNTEQGFKEITAYFGGGVREQAAARASNIMQSAMAEAGFGRPQR